MPNAMARFAMASPMRAGPYRLCTSVGRQDARRPRPRRIGEAIAKRAIAFGMKIRYHNRNKKNVPYPYDADLGDAGEKFGRADDRHAGGAGTAKLVNAKVLDALGPQGYVVNVARGSVVDEPVAAQVTLQEKKIAGAGLDVFEHEPKVPAEFFSLDNAVLYPHVASANDRDAQADGRPAGGELLLHFRRQTGKDKSRLGRRAPSSSAANFACPTFPASVPAGFRGSRCVLPRIEMASSSSPRCSRRPPAVPMPSVSAGCAAIPLQVALQRFGRILADHQPPRSWSSAAFQETGSVRSDRRHAHFVDGFLLLVRFELLQAPVANMRACRKYC